MVCEVHIVCGWIRLLSFNSHLMCIGVNLLDKLVKDIVVQADTFDIESFIPVLQKHIKKTKPYIRQLLVSWIAVLDTVPDIAMLDYLPEFLEGLFNMLSDPNKEIRQSADNTLQEFLNEIKQAEVVEFGPMVGILVNQCISREKFNRLRALQWIQLFIVLGGARLRLFYAELLGSILYCISDTEADISTAAKETNDALRNLVRSTTEKFEWMPVLSRLTTELISTHVITRVSALYWIKMLHEKDSYQMNQSISNLLPVLLKILSDDSDEVLVINLHVLARIAHDEIQFLRVLQALNQLFVNDRSLLETRGALIIRKLCALLDCKDIFITLANILNDKNDLEYVSLMVQTLNLILLTAPELAPLRKLLKECSQNNDANMEKEKDAKAIEITATNSSTNTANSGVDTNRLIDSYSTASYTNIDSKQVFIILYKCWCHNPVATLSLCLLAEYYELSSLLIFKFVDVDISVSFLMQIDKLIQLIESPIFLQLRLQLLDNHTKHHAELLKTLYGLLMILPQSVAYKTLSDRLATVSSLQMHLGFSQQVPLSKDERKKNMSFVQMDYTDCIARFEYIQQKHSTFKLALIQQKSLLYETDNVETAQPADGMASK